MRRWLGSWLDAARHVSDRPLLWLPGALAWTVSAGWIPLVVAVARPPTDADLTFLGAGIFTSGAWPWNAILIALAGVSLVIVGIALVAIAEAALLARLAGNEPRPRDAARLLGVHAVAVAPAFALALVAVTAAIVVAPAEFRGPETGRGPILATLVAISPLLVVLAISLVLGTAYAAAADRLGLEDGRDLASALAAAPRRLVAAGIPALAQAIATWIGRVVYLILTAVLLGVLWAPIGARLGEETARIDIGVGLLLVGFVAIWLCLVLGGGALHAWGSASWTRVLDRSVA